MTRGRPPQQAIREARAIGEKLGAVIETPGSRGFPADLMICCTHVTLYVQVKRTRSHLSGIREIADKYSKELLLLRTIPLTNVILRELWIRSPNGSWQYFRILKDGIMEIRNSGDFDRSTADFGQSATPPDPETVFTHYPEKGPVSPFGAGFTCPFFEYMKGKLSP
jgi:hypothetical protein